jgi:transcriptional regulator with XRE-family HTH domain
MKHRPKGMTQKQCAYKAGVNVDTVSRYERGENVSIEVEAAILKACGKKKVITDINS